MAVDTIVLYPSPGRGHIVSTVEFGKLLLRHYPAVTITVFVIPLPFESSSTDSYLHEVSTSVPSITFLTLPLLSPPAAPGGGGNSTTAIPTLLYQLPLLQNSNFRHLITDLSKSMKIKALVIDFFCNAAVSVADDIKIPCYFYFTSCLYGLAIFLYFPVIHESSEVSLKDVPDSLVPIPGLQSIPSEDIPPAMADRGGRAYSGFISTAYNMVKSAGIIVNTFELLEGNAFRAISEGRCTPGKSPPPIYCIGPIVEEKDKNGKDACLTWLDSQPKGSVVFLCFGSMGVFSRGQITEIAIGLERSGARFLWVVKNPAPGDETGGTMSSMEEPDLDSILPDGYMVRTKERGLVVKSWAPQVQVLNHESVGGFVTHCGWNSVLESLCAGVPMLGWPIYAEQKLNRHFLVQEMGVLLKLTETEDGRGMVSAGELEKGVVELMSPESEKGKAVRERVAAMQEGAAAAMSDGGSSRVAISKLVDAFKRE
uniref:Glycosyltransferase n=1 Tax=Linum usitatissimum TaxID=4006 RepID=I2BHC5_LINUS|nr:UDP-glycosyltransferase 1 [Linum usitatissimum]